MYINVFVSQTTNHTASNFYKTVNCMVSSEFICANGEITSKINGTALMRNNNNSLI